MSSDPVVSVVIPTYNHAVLLKVAIDSVVNQTYINWEIIVINNYSSDNTEELVNSYSDPRIRIVNYRNDGIIAASRNMGIKLSQGEYVAFLDSDDLWYPTKLSECINVFKVNMDADLVCTGEIWRKDGVEINSVSYGPSDKTDFRSLLFGGNCVSTSAVIIKRNRLYEAGCFSERKQFLLAEDYDLWIKLSKNGCKFKFIDKPLGEYIIHDDNNSHASLMLMRAELSILIYHFHRLIKKEPKDYILLLKRAIYIGAVFFVRLFK